MKLNILGARLRKISGNLSESSSTSHKENKHYRVGSDELEASRTIGDERLVFVSSEHKVPFAVSSVISFTKSANKSASQR